MLYLENINGINEIEINQLIERGLDLEKNRNIKKVLLIPPDITRISSNAGLITNMCFKYFCNCSIDVDVMPAVGTHDAMSNAECQIMFKDIPFHLILKHDWRDTASIGTVPGDYISQITSGMWTEDIVCTINKRLLQNYYDLVISLGQVLPHEIVGMSSHSKNILVGLGGTDMINKTHLISALYGIEKIMGEDYSPARKIFDYCMSNFLSWLPVLYIHTVTKPIENQILTCGVYIGNGRDTLEKAINLSKEVNIVNLSKKIKKCIVYMDPQRFKSTWVGNKAIYRTRMALCNDSELIINAPGLYCFGEDKIIDRLIRKYGYCGKDLLVKYLKDDKELQDNMAAAAHILCGSTDGRFTVRLCSQYLSKAEIESINYSFMSCDDFDQLYGRYNFNDGWNMTDEGEEIYYINSPSAGLWKG